MKRTQLVYTNGPLQPPLPAVSVSGGGDYRVESDTTHPMYFTVSRSGSTTSSLQVLFSFQGSAGRGTDFTASSILTIPAGFSSTTIALTPVNDATPEWTEKVRLTLSSSVSYTLGTAVSGTSEIVDDDIRLTPVAPGVMWVNNDDDNNNGWADLGEAAPNGITGEDDLTAFKLHVPDPLPGARVTIGWPVTKVRLWRYANRSNQIFDTSNPGTFTRTFGSPDGTGFQNKQVFVEAVAASTSVNGTFLTLSESDAGATPAPAHPTAPTATPATWTNASFSLVDYYTNKTGNIGTILSGQYLGLQTSIGVPEAWSRQITGWTIPGTYFTSYDAQRDYAIIETLQPQARSAFDFAWSDTGDSRRVSVRALINGYAKVAEVRVNVKKPVFDASVIMGNIYRFPQGDSTVFELNDPAGTPGHHDGLKYTASITTPVGFGTGIWYFSQVMTDTGTILLSNGTTVMRQYHGETVLDYAVSYADVDYFDAVAGIASQHSMGDSPNHTGTSNHQEFHDIRNFKTYLMYQPDDSTRFSRPVPPGYITWGFSYTAVRNGVNWEFQGIPTRFLGNFVSTNRQPEWSHYYDGTFIGVAP